MKFRAHETFFIRMGWLSKGMRNVIKKPNVFTDKNENPMDVLGIGSNMVKSLRYWLQAVGLTVEERKPITHQKLTDLGQLIYHHDRYIEEIGTLLLLHYKLVTNLELAPSWYYFFNKFKMREFTKDDFVALLQNELKMKGIKVALRSLNDDFICIVNTYVPKYGLDSRKVSPENNIVCPFNELGMINEIEREQGSMVYKKNTPTIDNFNPWVMLAVIIDQAKGKKEIKLNELLLSPENIGKVFNLTSISLLEILRRIEKLGELEIIRTAGLDIIRLSNNRTFLECVKLYYEEIKKEK